MIPFWQNILVTLGFSGLLTVVIVWLSKQVISERLKNAIKHEYNTELEKYKSAIAAKSNSELESIKAQLQSEINKNRVKFKKLHEKRTRLVERLYGNLVDMEKIARLGSHGTLMSKVIEKQNDHERIAREFVSLYQYNKIYFREQLCISLENIHKNFTQPLHEYHYKASRDNSSEAYNQLQQAFTEAHEFISTAKKEVELEFRELLGTEVESKLHI